MTPAAAAGPHLVADHVTVPLVKKPEEQQDTAYPPPSQSPLFIQNSPKHISAKVETGSLGKFVEKIDKICKIEHFITYY